jgi:hypothetical protein
MGLSRRMQAFKRPTRTRSTAQQSRKAAQARRAAGVVAGANGQPVPIASQKRPSPLSSNSFQAQRGTLLPRLNRAWDSRWSKPSKNSSVVVGGSDAGSLRLPLLVSLDPLGLPAIAAD